MAISIPQVRPWLGEPEIAGAISAIANNWITEGPKSVEFADRLKTLIGAPFGVFAPNGTLALALGLMALGIGPGDEVLVPDITFIGSAGAVILCGAIPVFVDVEPRTFQIDIAHAAQKTGSRTRAIMPVHLYGTACDMIEVGAFAQRHGLKVIEDAAQGIGVSHRGKHVGSFGDVGCFSFFADKTITTGEGGFVVCQTAEIFDRLRHLRNQGRLNSGNFVHAAVGYNFRITDIQAGIGLAQLGRLDTIIERKRIIYEWYKQGLACIDSIRLLGPSPESTHVPFRCVLIYERAKQLALHLESQGVQSRGFFHPMHNQPCFGDHFKGTDWSLSHQNLDFPNSTFGFENGLCLPIFPTISREEVEYITRAIVSFCSDNSSAPAAYRTNR
ncbi:perosamine synthetase [Bradyrhizobium sp. LB1.3]